VNGPRASRPLRIRQFATSRASPDRPPRVRPAVCAGFEKPTLASVAARQPRGDGRQFTLVEVGARGLATGLGDHDDGRWRIPNLAIDQGVVSELPIGRTDLEFGGI